MLHLQSLGVSSHRSGVAAVMMPLPPYQAALWPGAVGPTPVQQLEVTHWAHSQLVSGLRITAAVWGWGMLAYTAKHPQASVVESLQVLLVWDGAAVAEHRSMKPAETMQPVQHRVKPTHLYAILMCAREKVRGQSTAVAPEYIQWPTSPDTPAECSAAAAAAAD